MEVLNESAVESRRQLSTAEEKYVPVTYLDKFSLSLFCRLTLAHDELRNLNLKIRLI